MGVGNKKLQAGEAQYKYRQGKGLGLRNRKVSKDKMLVINYIQSKNILTNMEQHALFIFKYYSFTIEEKKICSR